MFSGYDPETGTYDPTSWMYGGCQVNFTAGAHEHATQAFSENTGAGMQGTISSATDARAPAVRLSDPAPTLCPLHARDGAAHLRDLSRGVHGGRRRADRELGARAHERVLLREWVDAALGGCADDPQCGDSAVAARQCRPARRRHHGAARARVDPRVDRHPDPLRPATRLPAHAADSRGSPDAEGVRRRRQGGSRLVVSFRRLHRVAAQGVVRRGRRPRRTITASAGCRS